MNFYIITVGFGIAIVRAKSPEQAIYLLKEGGCNLDLTLDYVKLLEMDGSAEIIHSNL